MTAPRYTYQRYLDDTWNARSADKPAADRWCVHALLKTGHLAPSHHGAAVRLSRLIERGQGQGGSAGGERVDGGNADPHARAWDAALCAREADCAIAAVTSACIARHWNTAPQAERRERVLASFHAALTFPHRNTTQAMSDAGWSAGGKQRDAFVAHLTEALDYLVTYFDANDAHLERARKQALDERYKSAERNH